MTGESIIFLNSHRAKSGVLNGIKLAPEYVLAAKFFDCGILDRSESLDVGFDYKVLDPIPDPLAFPEASFADICDARGKQIIREAVENDLIIQVLWSGGIDSTAALISILKHLPGKLERHLEVLLTMDSIDEYPLFFRSHILNQVSYFPIAAPVSDYFKDNALIITGEHGDQLFGSDKMLPLILNQLAFESHEVVLPLFLMNKFGHRKKVDQLIEFLQPLIQACPFPIQYTHELFWWFNFTMKWQQVSLRLAVFSFKENVSILARQFRHFFGSEAFQAWAMSHREPKLIREPHTYKLPAKQYIQAYTKDDDYFLQKIKQPSLRDIIINRRNQGEKRYRVVMKTDYIPQFEVFHKTLKNQNIFS